MTLFDRCRPAAASGICLGLAVAHGNWVLGIAGLWLAYLALPFEDLGL